MIPKKIHYCWFGGNPLPSYARRCINSWKKYCPDYEIIEWNETNFDVNYNGFTSEAYKCKKYAFVSDVARLKIIHENGGFYFDVDVQLLRPVEELRKEHAFLGTKIRQGTKKIQTEINTGLGFGAEKGNFVIGELLKMYDNKSFLLSNGEAALVPCNYPETEQLVLLGFKEIDTTQIIYDTTIYSTEYFGRKDITRNTYSIHLSANTWQRTWFMRKKMSTKSLLKAILGPKLTYCIIKLKHKFTIKNKRNAFFKI